MLNWSSSDWENWFLGKRAEEFQDNATIKVDNSVQFKYSYPTMMNSGISVHHKTSSGIKEVTPPKFTHSLKINQVAWSEALAYYLSNHIGLENYFLNFFSPSRLLSVSKNILVANNCSSCLSLIEQGFESNMQNKAKHHTTEAHLVSAWGMLAKVVLHFQMDMVSKDVRIWYCFLNFCFKLIFLPMSLVLLVFQEHFKSI